MKSIRKSLLTVSQLESRDNPSSTPFAFAGVYAIGVDAGETGSVSFHNTDGSVDFEVTPYGEDFTGGVRVAVADVTGDGTPDLIAAPGAGTAPTINVYDGKDGTPVASFDAYESSFTGGLYVAAADLNGDDRAEIVAGADQGGGPRVRVFDPATVVEGTAPAALADFMAIDDANFRGGIRLGLGDITADGVADLIVGAGYGGGPRVAAYDGAALGAGEVEKLFADFFAYEQGLRNGINVSVGDLNGDGCGDMIFGGGPGGGPRVRVADGLKVRVHGGGGSLDDMLGVQLANYFAGDPNSREGVRVGIMPSLDDLDTVDVVALDVESGLAGLYDEDGRSRGQLGKKGGFFACGPFDDSGYRLGGKSAEHRQDLDRGHRGKGHGPGGVGKGNTKGQVASEVVVIADPEVYAGEEATITVGIVDENGRVVEDYRGTVTFASTDPDLAAVLPDDYTFTKDDDGVRTFTIVPTTTGTPTLTVTDTADSSLTGEVDLNVKEAPVATQFGVFVRSRSGDEAVLVVMALDENNNVVKGYRGTVTFASSDPNADLPDDYTFRAGDNGVHAFRVQLETDGAQTISVADADDDTMTGSITLQG